VAQALESTKAIYAKHSPALGVHSIYKSKAVPIHLVHKHANFVETFGLFAASTLKLANAELSADADGGFEKRLRVVGQFSGAVLRSAGTGGGGGGGSDKALTSAMERYPLNGSTVALKGIIRGGSRN
jgi:hypothetical protein